MSTFQTGLFDLAQKRLSWIASRQNVLASNIANVNTPGYKARDVASFEEALLGYDNLTPAQTQPLHLSGTISTDPILSTPVPPVAQSIDRNTVILDQQLAKVADTETAQSLVSTIWKKYVGMFSTALGRAS